MSAVADLEAGISLGIYEKALRSGPLAVSGNRVDGEAWRVFLDTLASLVYLLSLRPRHALAVLRAWRGFLVTRGEYEAVRGENLRRTTTPPSPAILKPYSLLWHYYILRQRTYSQLP